MRILFFLLIILLSSCAKSKSSFICGDHKCINKAEAKQYFEENLTLEVSITSKKEESRYDLIGINLGQENQKIKILKKENKKIVRKLSKEEIKDKKKQLKSKKKSKSNEKVINKKTKKIEKKVVKKNTNLNLRNSSVDICLKLEKCNIDTISDYLIKLSYEKDFPNISLRE